MVFYIVGLIIAIIAFFDYKKAFMLYLVFKLLLGQNITVISVPGVPLLTLDMFMGMFFLLLFVLKKKHLKKASYSYPFVTSAILVFISWLISSLFSVAGIASEASALIGNILNELIIIVIAWNIIETKSDFDFIFSLITIVIFASCIYGFIEYSLQDNPLSLYEATLNHDPSRVVNWSYGAMGPRGYHVKSIFEHAISASVTWALYAAFVFTSVISYGEHIKIYYFAILTAILCIPLIILTKQRSGLVLLLLLSLLFIKPQKKKMYIFVIPAVIGVGLFFNEIAENIGLFLSLFSSKYQTSVSGSSASMRINQFQAAFELMSKSPIWGLGSKYLSIISNSLTERLLGSESVWLMVIPSYGLIGMVTYLFQIFWNAFVVAKFFKAKDLCFLICSFWVVYSLTSLPGFDICYLYLFSFYIIKKTPVYKSTQERICEWRVSKGKIWHKKLFL